MSRSFAGQMSLALSPPVTSYSAPVTMFAASEASRSHRRSARSGPSDDVRLIKCAAGCRIRIPHAEDWLQKIVPRECQLLRRHQLPGKRNGERYVAEHHRLRLGHWRRRGVGLPSELDCEGRVPLCRRAGHIVHEREQQSCRVPQLHDRVPTAI
jgi:hypothetical protein